MIAHDIRAPTPCWSIHLEQSLHDFYHTDEPIVRPIYSLSSLNSGNGRAMLAVGSSGGMVTLLQEDGGQVVFDQSLHRGDVRSLLLTMPDSLYSPVSGNAGGFELVTTSYDSNGAVWSCGRRSNGMYQCIERAQLTGAHKDKVLSVMRFAETGDLVTSDAEGRLVYWKADYY